MGQVIPISKQEVDSSFFRIPLLLILVVILNIIAPDNFYSFLILTNVPFLVLMYLFTLCLSFLVLYRLTKGRLPMTLFSLGFTLFTLTLISLLLIGMTYNLFSIDLLIFGYIFSTFLKGRKWMNSTILTDGFI